MEAALALLIALIVLATLALLLPRRGQLHRWQLARRRGERMLVEDALKHIHARELRGTLATAESLAGKLSVTVK